MDTAVALVRAYLELCGYFVLTEVPVRASIGGAYRDVTDLDVLAVRFPYPPAGGLRPRNRPLELFLGTDPALRSQVNGVDVIIGEVKEGRARLNPALTRAETVAFALRRLGCCPEAEVPAQARQIAAAGTGDLTMPGGLPCRIRLVAFAGTGVASATGVQTISLGHCASYVTGRLRAAGAVLAGVQFKEPVLGLLALLTKLEPRRPGVAANRDAGP